jgi:WD40 repeat protein
MYGRWEIIMKSLVRCVGVSLQPILFVMLAGAVWWFMPPAPRALLTANSEILRLSPDGSLVATRQEGRVKLWETASGGAAGELPGDLGSFPGWGFLFSPDGRWLAAGGAGVLKLWELPGGREREALQVSDDKDFRPLPAFSADGKWLAFRTKKSGHKFQVQIWELAQGRLHATLDGRAGPLHFSPDGKLLAFESLEPKPNGPAAGRIRLWDSATGRETMPFGDQPAPLRHLTFSPDGRTLAAGERKRANWQGDYELKLLELATGKYQGPWRLSRGVSGLRFTADGSRLLVTSFDKSWRLSLIDPTDSPGEVFFRRLESSVSFSVSADGRLLAHSRNQPDEPAIIIDLPDLRPRARLRPHHSGERLFLCDFTPDGRVVAALGGWNDRSPSRRGRRLANNAPPSSPDTETPDVLEGELHLYDTATGQAQGSVPVVRSAAIWFAPDAKTLVVLGPEATPTIWDLPLPTAWGQIILWWAVLSACFVGATFVLRRLRKSALPGVVENMMKTPTG